MSYKLHEVEGIGAAYAEKLAQAGLATTDHLLEKGGTRQGRADLATASGISEHLILKWVNHSDLFRIKGIAGQFAELLEAAGVDTVKEFRNRVPENLHAKLEEVNQAKHLTGRVPSLAELTDMIHQAKQLEPRITY
jgi:predicted flap endonuclease-1-like 5' DNA nuclease